MYALHQCNAMHTFLKSSLTRGSTGNIMIEGFTKNFSFDTTQEPQQLRSYNCACGFIIGTKSAVIKYHQIVVKSYKEYRPITGNRISTEQLATAFSSLTL